MSTLTSRQSKLIGIKSFPIGLKRQLPKPQESAIEIELFRYKDGGIQILHSWEERNSFLFSRSDLEEIARHKRFFIRVIVNQFKFVVPIGFENPSFYEGGKFLRILYEEKNLLLEGDCPLAIRQALQTTKNKIKNGESLVFCSKALIGYLPEDYGRPVIFNTDSIRCFGRDQEKGLFLIENGIGLRSLDLS